MSYLAKVEHKKKCMVLDQCENKPLTVDVGISDYNKPTELFFNGHIRLDAADAEKLAKFILKQIKIGRLGVIHGK